MKKIAKILMMLAFLFCAVSCNSIDKSEFDISQETKGSDQRENIARVIASMNIDNAEVSKIHAGVLKALDEGLHETYFMKELMCEDSKIVKGENQTSVFIEYIEKLVKNDDSLNQLLDYYNEGNNANILQIYWPFSENWDGKTKPVISFLPEDKTQATNKAYYMENGELKSVEIDRNYAMLHPVWIINESSLGYDKIPDFNEKRKGDFLNISPRKQNTENKLQQTTRSNLVCALELRGIRTLMIPGNSFFCESHTYTFHFNLPDPNDRTSTTYQQVVLTLTQAQLISGEYFEQNILLDELGLNANYHRALRLTITKYVEPKILIVQVPMRIYDSGQTIIVMSEMLEPESAYLFYGGTIDLQPFYDNPFDSYVFACEELEWTLGLVVYSSI